MRLCSIRGAHCIKLHNTNVTLCYPFVMRYSAPQNTVFKYETRCGWSIREFTNFLHATWQRSFLKLVKVRQACTSIQTLLWNWVSKALRENYTIIYAQKFKHTLNCYGLHLNEANKMKAQSCGSVLVLEYPISKTAQWFSNKHCMNIHQRFSNCGTCPRGGEALLVLWGGGQVDCTMDILILNEI
jgi:hypothetical protein